MVVGPRGRMRPGGGFLYLYFLFSFFTKIYFRVRNLHEYIPATPLPGGRDLAARQPGCRGLSAKKTRQKIASRSLENRPPGSWAASPPGRPAAGRRGPGRPPAGRPPPKPYISCWLPLTPSFAALKNPKKRKEMEGGR